MPFFIPHTFRDPRFQDLKDRSRNSFQKERLMIDNRGKCTYKCKKPDKDRCLIDVFVGYLASAGQELAFASAQSPCRNK